jgi:uncharacterized protein with PQ loop repeat
MAHRTPQKTPLRHALHTKKAKRTVTTLVYLVSVGGNIAVIPQILKAWQSNAPGLAVLTWLMFVCFGLVWLTYSIQIKEKPLIVAQIANMTCNMAVVLGWVFNNWLR